MSEPKSWRDMTDEEYEQLRLQSAERDRIVIEMKNGVALMIPSRLLQGVAGASPDLIAKVETDSRGYAIIWDELDAGLTIPGLLASRFGNENWMDELRARGELPSASPISTGNSTKSARPRKIA